MELLTISEYAKLKGISKQAVYKQLKTSLKDCITIKNGQKYIRIDTAEQDTETEENDTETVNQFNNQLNNHSQPDKLIEIIENQQAIIDDLNEQVKSLQTQINQQTTELTTILKEQVEQAKNYQYIIAQQQQLLNPAVNHSQPQSQPQSKPKFTDRFKRKKQ